MTMLFVAIGWDAPDSKEKRPSARPDHLAHWKSWADSGRIIIAGPMTDFAGSLFIVEAESQEEVDAQMKNDPYLSKGVFLRTEVHPFKGTLPEGRWS